MFKLHTIILRFSYFNRGANNDLAYNIVACLRMIIVFIIVIYYTGLQEQSNIYVLRATSAFWYFSVLFRVKRTHWS